MADLSEPTVLTITLPPEMGECEVVAQFLAYPRGASIDANTGEPKITLGVPIESKYEALQITDHGGEIFKVVVIGIVRPEIPQSGEDTNGDE